MPEVKCGPIRKPKPEEAAAPRQDAPAEMGKEHPYTRERLLAERLGAAGGPIIDEVSNNSGFATPSGELKTVNSKKEEKAQPLPDSPRELSSSPQDSVLDVFELAKKLYDPSLNATAKLELIQRLSTAQKKENYIRDALTDIMADTRASEDLRAAAVRAFSDPDQDYPPYIARLIQSPDTPLTVSSALIEELFKGHLGIGTRAWMHQFIADKNADFTLRCCLVINLAEMSQKHHGYPKDVLELARNLAKELLASPDKGNELHRMLLYKTFGMTGGKDEAELLTSVIQSSKTLYVEQNAAHRGLASLVGRNGIETAPELKATLLKELSDPKCDADRRKDCLILLANPDGNPPYDELVALAKKGGMPTSEIFPAICTNGGQNAFNWLSKIAFSAGFDQESRDDAFQNLCLHTKMSSPEERRDFCVQVEKLLLDKNVNTQLKQTLIATMTVTSKYSDVKLSEPVLAILREEAKADPNPENAAPQVLLTLKDPALPGIYAAAASRALKKQPPDSVDLVRSVPYMTKSAREKLRPEILKQLAKYGTGDDSQSRICAENLLNCLDRLATKEDLEIVRPFLKSSDSLHMRAAALLTMSGDKEGLEHLARLGSTNAFRDPAVEALLASAEPAATKLLFEALSSAEDLPFRTSLTRALKGPEQLKAFAKVLHDYANEHLSSVWDKKRVVAYAAALEKCADPKFNLTAPARLTVDSLIDIVKNREEGPVKGQKVAAVIVARDDHNAAMASIAHGIEQLRKQGYRVMFYEAGDEPDRSVTAAQAICSSLHNATTTKKGRIIPADFVFVVGHGSPKGIMFGADVNPTGQGLEGRGAVTADDLSTLSSVARNIRAGATFCLCSCSTGYGENMPGLNDNMANGIRKALPHLRSRGIISPTEPTGFFEFRFDKDGQVIDAGFTTPRYFASNRKEPVEKGVV